MVEYSRQWLLDPYWGQRIFWGGLELYIMSASKATDTSFLLWMRPQVNNQYCTLTFSCCASSRAHWHAGFFWALIHFQSARIILHYQKHSQDHIALPETSSGSDTGLQTLSRVGMWKSEPVYNPLGSSPWWWNSPRLTICTNGSQVI